MREDITTKSAPASISEAPEQLHQSGNGQSASWVDDACEALLRLARDPKNEAALTTLGRLRAQFTTITSLLSEPPFVDDTARKGCLEQSVQSHSIATKDLPSDVGHYETQLSNSRPSNLARDPEVDSLPRVAVDDRDVVLNELRSTVCLQEQQLLALRSEVNVWSEAFERIVAGLTRKQLGARGISAQLPDDVLIQESEFFDSEWYCSRCPDIIEAGIDPTQHFLRKGTSEHRNPNELFDSRWYVAQFADAAESDHSPLVHYLRYGAAEGWPPSEEVAQLLPTDADFYIQWCPPSLAGAKVALLIQSSADPASSRRTNGVISALRANGFSVVLVFMTDEIDNVPVWVQQLSVDGLAIRFATGHAFMALVQFISERPDVLSAKMLLIVSGDAFGPLCLHSLDLLLQRTCRSSADLICASAEGDAIDRVVDSYFLAIRGAALRSEALLDFCASVKGFPAQGSTLRRCEARFTGQLTTAGFQLDVIFPIAPDGTGDRLGQWMKAIAAGLPFLRGDILNTSMTATSFKKIVALLSRGAPAEDKHAVLASLVKPWITGHNVSEFALADFRRLKGRPKTQPIVPRKTKRAEPLRISFIGPWNFAVGLGVASRGYLSALWQSNASVNLYPVTSAFHVHARTQLSFEACDFEGISDVSIVHLNPDAWSGALDRNLQKVMKMSRVRVGLWVWEMEQIPRDWLSAIDGVDAIWTPTEYCRRSFAAVSDKPVKVLPHVVVPPPAEVPAGLRKRLGLPTDRRIILYCFDGASFLVRKNPHALVRAFARSNLARAGWCLVIKAKNLHDNKTEGANLIKLCKESKEVFVVDQPLSLKDQGGLFASCDVYASPHCSEGFGLTIAEAMALGKVVVATDYGGSRDFLDNTCGFPVAWRREILEQSYGPYRRGGIWAKIDEEDLTRALSEAAATAESPSGILQSTAAARVRDTFSPASIGRRVERLCEELLK